MKLHKTMTTKSRKKVNAKSISFWSIAADLCTTRSTWLEKHFNCSSIVCLQEANSTCAAMAHGSSSCSLSEAWTITTKTCRQLSTRSLHLERISVALRFMSRLPRSSAKANLPLARLPMYSYWQMAQSGTPRKSSTWLLSNATLTRDFTLSELGTVLAKSWSSSVPSKALVNSSSSTTRKRLKSASSQL